MAQRPPAEPTTPGGKLPQYQLGHLHRGDDVSDLNNPSVRIILALPSQPILVEARITVDGKPFRQLREERVAEILKFATDPDGWRKSAQEAALRSSPIEAASSVLDGLSNVVSEVIAEVDAPQVDATEVETGEEATENVPEVPAYVAPLSLYERVERYIAATGEQPSADEIRWMLTNWVDGPVMLFLNDNFQRFRADQRPVFKILDRDRSGDVTADELEMAVKSFTECDLNRNDIVEHTELAEVATDPRDEATHAGAGKLVFSVPTAANAMATYRRLAAQYKPKDSQARATVPRFDGDSDSKFNAEELKVLTETAADVQLDIAFDSTNPSRSTLSIASVGESFASAIETAVVNFRSVTLEMGPDKVDFCAVQSTGSDQIAIGAVNDGYPMLPLVDPNDDGRFTIRELRELNQRLASFDRNEDGRLTADETTATIRLCFGLGPGVHQELATLRSIQPTSREPAVRGPEWFTEMDVNKDNDLSRKEFKGNDEQFVAFDTDSDELVSATEAIEFETRNN